MASSVAAGPAPGPDSGSIIHVGCDTSAEAGSRPGPTIHVGVEVPAGSGSGSIIHVGCDAPVESGSRPGSIIHVGSDVPAAVGSGAAASGVDVASAV